MKDEVLFCEFAVGTVHDDHVFLSIRYGAFVTDIGTSQSIVASYHHTVDFGLFEFFDGIGSLFFQGILENFKSVEGKIVLHLVSTPSLYVLIRNWLASDCQNSKPMRCVFFEYFVVIFGDGVFLHDGEHHFRRSLCVNMISFGERRFSNNAHPLQL